MTLLGVFSRLRHFFTTFSQFDRTFPDFNWVSGIFGALSIVGFLLFLIAMYGFSKDYNEHRIFSNLMYGILFTIIAIVVATVVVMVIVLFNVSTLFPNLGSSTSSPQISASFSRTLGLLSPIFSS